MRSMRSTRSAFVCMAVLALVLTACGGGSKSPSQGDVGADFVLKGWPMPSWLKLPPIETMTGRSDPEGDPPAHFTALKISPEEVQRIRDKHLRAAFLNWSGVPYNQAFTSGIRRAFSELGVDLVATTNFEFDAVKASSDVLNVLPLNPDIIITGVLDPAQWPEVLKPALDKGITIEMWSQGIQGIPVGDQLCNITSYDPAYDGATVAEGIHKWYPNGANVGVIRWSFNHPVVKGRDKGFLDTLKKYPNLKVVADLPMDDPNKADVVAAALITRHPEVNVIYGPWDSPPSEGIVAAIRASGRNDIKVATMDLGNTGAHEIAHNGIIFHDTAQAVYEGGRTMAIAAAKCKLGGASRASVPKFLIVPTYGVDKTNLNTGWTYMHGPEIKLPAADQIPGT
jgi:ribose transport system substrate-binding protein